MSSERTNSSESELPEQSRLSTENTQGQGAWRDQGRHAVVGLLYEDRHFLVIRRSQFVRAPGLICFPGGGIEPGEDLHTAVKRELMEELNLAVEVCGHLWTSQTRWGTKLEWLVCQRQVGHEPSANPQEVEEVLWMTPQMLLGRDDLLGSMPEFLDNFLGGHFDEHFDRT
jgi:8-oxo-dGTP pyrophosphatase MutT (NUDIX family)